VDEANASDRGLKHVGHANALGDIELHGTNTTGLKVDEERAISSDEHIARMWLTMQQLLGGPATA
jgi:hypothetical protein